MVTTTSENWADLLFSAASNRARPEDVARIVLEQFPGVPCGSAWNRRANVRWASYMDGSFRKPAPLTHSANVLAILLEREPLTDSESLGLPMLELLDAGRSAIGAMEHGFDFKYGRLNRERRAEIGLKMSRRRYNKLFRLVGFLESEFELHSSYGELCELMRGAKSGLARFAVRSEVASDWMTSAFFTYMVSRMNRRSVFTNESQERPFDDLAEGMLKALGSRKDGGRTEWMLVAYVFPRVDVLSHLTDEEKLRLLTLAIDQMSSAAKFLKELHKKGGIDYRKSCVVQRGQDSSTWNATAGAWNKAREMWLSITCDLGVEIGPVCPGKVPRLMAADVAAWHRQSGGGPHPDELVCAELPTPWEVLSGAQECTIDQVEAVCRSVGVDPRKTGWTQPRDRKAVEPWKPTPELVHGVSVSDPLAALVMRRMGWFSGPAKFDRENYAERFWA